MTTRSKRALELMRMILEYESEYTVKVAPLQRELDSLMPDDGLSEEKATRNFAGKGEVVPGGIPSQILEILNVDPGRVFDTKDFFSIGKIQSVRSALHRMKSDGQIECVDRGRYRALPQQGGSRDCKP